MKPLLDVLVILDALEKEGSFAAASAKLFKTPSALSYTIHRLESDLNIQLLDRSGHRARFTPSGQMLLEKGREVLHIARELEIRAVKLQQGWENSLRLAVDSSFPVALLSPPIAAFYQQQPLTRLHFTLNPSLLDWRPLTDGQADLLLKMAAEFKKTISVACTGCRYCCPDCPQGIDIPRVLEIYNQYKLGGPWQLGALDKLPEGKRPEDCIGCGSCTAHCPQNIDVPAYMQEMAAARA